MRWSARGSALVVLLALSACAEQIGMPPAGSDQGGTVGHVFDLYLGVAGVVGTLVVLLLAFVLVRDRASRKGEGQGSQRHHNTPLEIAYTVIPLIIVLGLTVITVVTIGDVDSTSPDPDLVVDVEGFQWGWTFTYVDQGVAITTEADRRGPELVLPSPADIRFDVHSDDVIHSFWVPAFRFKRDLIPGHPTSFSVDTDELATYDGHCAEYCGLYHSEMTFTVRTVDRASFSRWLTEQRDGP